MMFTSQTWRHLLPLALLSRHVSSSAIPEQLAIDHPGKVGAVATESIECSEIGRDILAAGGNAVDALVGSTFCVGVIGMYHSGIGGGGYMIVRGSDGQMEVVDFRETAPAAAYEDMYLGNVNGSIFGGLAAGVPGEVRGLEYAHRKYGKLPWKDVMQGAIRVAREGFTVSSDLVRYMGYAIAGRGENFLVEDPTWAIDFAPNGTLLGEGDTIKRRRYADTLELIAEHGGQVFYDGVIAKAMVAEIQKTNGTMTLADLSGYKLSTHAPISSTFRNHTLHTCGASASGAVLLATLNVMEQYHLGGTDTADYDLRVHRFTEAMRFAYGARARLGDPDFVPEAADVESTMLEEETARSIRDKILDDRTQPVENYAPEKLYAEEGHGTSHVVTADGSGMATGLTTTINLLFGAQIMDPVTGIIINNEMNDFSIPNTSNEFGFPPSPSNYIRPFKRPLSSITPVIVEDPSGELYMTVGAAGGSRIISSTTQVIWRVLDLGATLKEALAEPRLHDQLMPNVTTFEYPFNNCTVDSMRERGHEVAWVREGFSSVQGIRLTEEGLFEAASEPRQKNSAGLTV